MVIKKRSASSSPDRRTTSKMPLSNATSTHCMLTRGITTAMSRNAAVNTAELLANILQHLQVSDLLDLRRVNKYFKVTIDSSPQLQINMFLRGTKDAENIWMYNHNITRLYPYIRGDAQRYGEKWVRSHSVMRPSVLNPMLFKTDEEERRPPLKYRARICESIQFTRRPDVTRTKDDSISHRMLVCQPPVPVVEFQICFNPNKSSRKRAVDGFLYKDSHFRGKVKNSNGVTFGDLIKKLRKTIEEGVPAYLPSSGFRVHVSEKKQSAMSKVWMLGAIFVDKQEKDAIEDGMNQPMIVSPLAEKMRKPEFLRDVAEGEKKGHGSWVMADYEFAGDWDVEEEVFVDYDGGSVEMNI